MAFGFFNVEEPGLTYLQRKSYKLGTGLSLDPTVADAPVAGEWLTLADDQTLDRVDLDTADSLIAFPLLVDKSRTDLQSGEKATVVAHPGAICNTGIFATLDKADGPLTYNVGDLLGVCRFWDPDGSGVLRQGLYPQTKAAGTPGAANTSGTAGAIQTVNGDSGTSELAAVAKVLRVPYAITGVGVSGGRSFPAEAGKLVLDIQIL